MSKETLEVYRGISQAMGYAYDGAIDDDGKPIEIGLKRDEKEHDAPIQRRLYGWLWRQNVWQ